MKGLLGLIGLILVSPVALGECRATGEGPVAVVELYTSEGCSSCPPADRWLSTLGAAGKGPLRVVPLALHVPYWDYIGWKDRFASPAFEARQRLAARQARATTVYTPQVLVNGHDFRGWGSERFQQLLQHIASQPAQATLTLSARRGPAGTEATVSGRAPAGARVVLAGIESGLSTQVQAGENAGARLAHDHVVRHWAELGAVGPEGRFELRHAVPAQPDAAPARTALTALIEDPASGQILQAVVLPWCGGT
jgi:hypothetical protein